jgi:NAD(P)-dependent dehydrogenase (short-subunit alcohol dehydrogenase family)
MPSSYRGLSRDTVMLVTAGASGIGATIARAALAQGCRVHVCDVSPEAVRQFQAENPGASATIADVSSPADVERVFADLARLGGRLDVLVNNAGIAGPTAPVEEMAIADWDRTIAVDLNAVFYVTRLAVPLLKAAGGGSIVNISSSAAFGGFPLRSPYSAAKWALVGLTKTWAMELGAAKIRVNAVCPGSVKGPRIERVIAAAAQEMGVEANVVRKKYLDQTSLGIFVDADDIAQMILFLASSLGAAISGQVIGIDGHQESMSYKS